MENIDIHIYPSNFKHETRMQKETKSLVDGGLFDKIFIVALWESGLEEHENLDDKREVWRVPLKTASWSEGTFPKIIKHFEWMLKIFRRFKKEDIKCVNCHNLSSMPIGFLFKIFCRSRLIYDTHELETERCGWGKARRVLAKILERLVIYRSDIVFVVSESIAKWYREHYPGINVQVVYNFPRREVESEGSDSDILKDKFNIQDGETLFIYQGALGNGRYIDLMLDIFVDIDKRKHIVFMGYGSLEDKVKKYSKKFSNIHFQPAVKPTEVLSYTKSADVGLSLIENTCLSYYLTLANKVVEYIVSGVPVITTNFPESEKIVNTYDCGWSIEADKQEITDLIKSISREDIREKRNNALSCRDNFSWRTEEEKLLKAYRDLNNTAEKI